MSDAIFFAAVLRHDLNHLRQVLHTALPANVVDTLYLSPLLFPERSCHALLKDGKLLPDELNTPLNDVEKARLLFDAEADAFRPLSPRRKEIYYGLLCRTEEFKGFFAFVKYRPLFPSVEQAIRQEFKNKICEHANLQSFLFSQFNGQETSFALKEMNERASNSGVPQTSWNGFTRWPLRQRARGAV